MRNDLGDVVDGLEVASTLSALPEISQIPGRDSHGVSLFTFRSRLGDVLRNYIFQIPQICGNALLLETLSGALVVDEFQGRVERHGIPRSSQTAETRVACHTTAT